jgi:hypothetical protein
VSAARRRLGWIRYTDEQLLDLRFRDLGLRIERTAIEPRIERLYDELDRREIRLKPHIWLSTEWFSPDGVPGVAVPFYLAHPRLIQLEARQMLEVEGGNDRECMRILRHEAGHAICTAYRLHYRKRWREIFGRYSQAYPRYYRPRPNSRNFVVHLAAWYAQAHPAEDFAETFAVWLGPRAQWRKRYRDWLVALRKLEYVDELMSDIAGESPVVRSRLQVEPLGRLNRTLRQHYRMKRKRYGVQWPDFYDRDLRRLFSREPRHRTKPTAVRFLREVRPELLALVNDTATTETYTVDQVLKDIIDRCRELRLRLARPRHEARLEAAMLLTVHTMKILQSTRREIPL